MHDEMNRDKAADITETGLVDMHSRAAAALVRVGVCVRSVGLYGRNHPMIEDMVKVAHQSLAEMLALQPNLVISSTETYLAMDSFPIEDPSGALGSLARVLWEKQISELTFRAGVGQDQLLDLCEVLSTPVDDLHAVGGAINELSRREVTSIIARSGVLPIELREANDPADIYEEALLLVEQAMKAVQAGLRIPTSEIRSVVASSLHSLISDESVLLVLAGVRSYDRYLSEHSVNVCILSMVLGRDLGLDTATALELGISAMLHDVGKVFVPNDIVTKPGRLTEEEWLQIKRHPGEGSRALAVMEDMPALAPTIALEHHVYCDGTGYPALPPDHRPHLLSRLVAIIDTYDALTTERPYREKWTPQQSIAWMLYEAGNRYDRRLMARFASRAQLYAPGALVRLSRGDIAVVVGGNYRTPTLPKIRIVTGPSSSDVEARIIDMSENQDPGLTIESMAQPVEVLLPYADLLAA